MTITPEERRTALIHGEQTKLLASWINTIAANVVAIGILVPFAGYIYGINSPQIPGSTVPFLMILWITCGIGVHLAGEWVLTMLELQP